MVGSRSREDFRPGRQGPQAGRGAAAFAGEQGLQERSGYGVAGDGLGGHPLALQQVEDSEAVVGLAGCGSGEVEVDLGAAAGEDARHGVSVDDLAELDGSFGVAEFDLDGEIVDGDVGRAETSPEPVAVCGELFGQVLGVGQVGAGCGAVASAADEDGGQEQQGAAYGQGLVVAGGVWAAGHGRDVAGHVVGAGLGHLLGIVGVAGAEQGAGDLVGRGSDEAGVAAVEGETFGAVGRDPGQGGVGLLGGELGGRDVGTGRGFRDCNRLGGELVELPEERGQQAGGAVVVGGLVEAVCLARRGGYCGRSWWGLVG
jgi:hypothetical protein